MTQRPIYYDTETTGVHPERDKIIEIAAFDPENNRSFVKLINPEIAIPPEATAIHHITNEMVQNAPLFQEVAEEFTQFCAGDVVLIAHNNDSFDQPFLTHAYRRAGLSFPPFQFIDSLKWARKYRPDLPRHTLQSLRELYGIEANQAHRALDDVMVLYRVFSYMIDDLPLKKIQELLAQKQGLTRMPFGKHQGKALSEIPKSYVKWLNESGALSKAENAELRSNFETLGLLPLS